MDTEDLTLAQTITSIVSTGAEEGSVAASVDETLVTRPTLEVAITQDSSHTSISEAPVVTLPIKELLVQLAPALMGVTSAPPWTSESVPVTVVETGSMSALANPASVVNILKDLIFHMIDQFFSALTYCTGLVFSGRNPFELMRPLLVNHVENIWKVRGSNQTKVYQARVEQLGSYVVDLRNLEGASLVKTAQLILSKLRAEQQLLFEEAKKEIAERSRHLVDTRASYQGLSNDL